MKISIISIKFKFINFSSYNDLNNYNKKLEKSNIPLSTRPKIKLVAKENAKAGYWEFVIEKKDKSEIEFYTLQIFEKTKTGTFETKIFENFLKENTYNQALKKGEYKIVATATDEFGLVGRDEVSVVVGWNLPKI